eukprot:TRINITY_DN2268_c0_g2_i1.p1 TRINITY_DN2268_c0_g2~~TRINITY_DN2268_c0_g2_i1.p1  ORF type:complete len:106 (+),score=1.59 TRINITY_DN2268_c0_g2_i1:411-728(+)
MLLLWVLGGASDYSSFGLYSGRVYSSPQKHLKFGDFDNDQSFYITLKSLLLVFFFFLFPCSSRILFYFILIHGHLMGVLRPPLTQPLGMDTNIVVKFKEMKGNSL